MSMVQRLVELPIDHFRLLGVSPAVEAESVLRALELRLDRIPEKGFTQDALAKREELLRASSDLLLDSSRREEYEKSLLSGSSGIELPVNREVAGLILLWEADSCVEAFRLAVKCLQPPNSPALGSGRESDLTLIAALACDSGALQEQELRHYEAAAVLLQDGVKLLQRMGKLPQQRRQLEQNLQDLLPYRILDLLSRDLGDDLSHQEGIRLLDRFVRARGGIEGKSAEKLSYGLDQSEFELFFKQIRKFLTVQEQIDLFVRWKQAGSLDAGFLSVISLTAAGFSWRKPERLVEARKQLGKLNIKGFDPMPMLACLDLLLAEVQLAEQKFQKSNDVNLRDWISNYPEDNLAALCEYCRDWLRKDVLPGYRDLDSDPIDLEAWFADRDVQAFVERQDKRRGHLGAVKDKAITFLSSLSTDQRPSEEIDKKLEESSSASSASSTSSASSASSASDKFVDQIVRSSSEVIQSNPEENEEFNNELSLKDTIDFGQLDLSSLRVFSSKVIGFYKKNFKIRSLVIVLMAFAAAISLWELSSRKKSEKFDKDINTVQVDSIGLSQEEVVDSENIDTNLALSASWVIAPLMADQPSEVQLRNLLEAWLASKSAILAGGSSESLPNVARKPLVKRVLDERAKDLAKGQLQKVQANILSFKVVSRKPTRIELNAKLSYRDQRLDSSGDVLVETLFPSLNVTYIFGKDGNYWRLHEYISGR